MEIKEENLFLHEELHKKQDQYPQYVINLQNQLFSKNDAGSVLVNLQDMIECDKDRTVALLENLLSLVKKAKKDSNIRIDACKLKSKSWSNYQSGFSAYIEIIKDHIKNYCCPLKVSEQRDIHPQCCCNGIADDFSEGKPLS